MRSQSSNDLGGFSATHRSGTLALRHRTAPPAAVTIHNRPIWNHFVTRYTQRMRDLKEQVFGSMSEPEEWIGHRKRGQGLNEVSMPYMLIWFLVF